MNCLNQIHSGLLYKCHLLTLYQVFNTYVSSNYSNYLDQVTAQNLSLMRKISLNLAKNNKSKKCGMKSKLKLAGWDEGYLEELLFKTPLF